MQINEKLIRDCMDGQRKAQFELYKLCYPLFMSICSRYNSNELDARSALNTGFLKILNGLEKRNDSIPFAQWAKRVMINNLIDQYRKANSVRSLHIESHLEVTEYSENGVDWNQADMKLDAEEIENMIRELPGLYQQVFNLFAIDGYSHQEIAEKLEMTETSSKWYLHTARKKLQKQICELYNLKTKTHG